jgi:hypothetical protein
VTATIGSKPVAGFLEVRAVGTVVNRFKKQVNDLQDDFVSHARNPSFAHLASGLRNEGRSDGLEAKLFGPHVLDTLLNGFQRAASEGFPIASRSHVSWFRLDAFVGDDGQVLFVHESLHIVVDPLSVAIHFS